MSWYAACLLLFGCLAVAFATGMPAAFSFFAINIAGAYQYLGGDAGLAQLVRNGVNSITNFSLTPIPFFILMGEVLFHTGVAMKAIDAIERLIRRVPGRLAVVAVVAGTIFSAISGSTIATTAMLGSLMLPEMLRRGYHPSMAMGPIMAIGGVDMLIPPSALTVLLGSLAGISISHLLVAGIVPGLLLAAVFVAYIIVRAKARPEVAPSFQEAEEVSGWERWRPLVAYVLPLALIFGVVIGAMSAGWATPTESAALGAVATVAVAALYRSLKLSSLMKALLGTAAISSVILFIIVGATTFSQILAFSGATSGLVAAVRDAGFGAGGVLI
ncbi:MAG TPA: TRAP transporter large permease subunit, partial [Burkholderiales bacterium]|nr:TRAP transporter large permease subunit [Burkholderiales bacterium]